MEKKSIYLFPQRLLFISFVLPVFVFVVSCGNKKQAGNEVSTSDTTLKKKDTTKTEFTGIRFPVYEIQYNYLMNLPKGVITDKPKLLLKASFADISNPAGMKLTAYFTKTHGHYAEDQAPVPESEITKGADVSEEFTDVVIGNNDIVLKKILKKNGQFRDCNYFKFIPVKVKFEGDPRNHLRYLIKAVKVTFDANKKRILTEEDAGYSNPTPPGRPSED